MRIVLKMFLIALMTLEVSAGDYWHFINSGIEDNLAGIHFCDENRGYFLAGNGTILNYKAPGIIQKGDNINTPNTSFNIYFHPDCRHGFVCGSKGSFLTTEDGGSNWRVSRIDSSMFLMNMAFLDSLRGIMIAYNKNISGVIYRTIDGGKKWDSLSLSIRRPLWLDISPEKIITITGIDRILISRDGGESWESLSIPGAGMAMAGAINGQNGIIVGMRGLLALSSDEGKSWRQWNALPDSVHLYGIIMLSPLRAYAIGANGAILYTEDSGQNWIVEPIATAAGLTYIRRAGNKIFICGQSGVILSKDIEPETP
jgi:photosystem II stability/assembly factor-like uncharacterized protein